MPRSQDSIVDTTMSPRGAWTDVIGNTPTVPFQHAAQMEICVIQTNCEIFSARALARVARKF
jgi:hypothetical protein